MSEHELRERIEKEIDVLIKTANQEYDHATEEPTSMPPMRDGEVDQQWVNDLGEMEFALYALGRHDGLKEAVKRLMEALDTDAESDTPAGVSGELVDVITTAEGGVGFEELADSTDHPTEDIEATMAELQMQNVVAYRPLQGGFVLAEK